MEVSMFNAMLANFDFTWVFVGVLVLLFVVMIFMQTKRRKAVVAQQEQMIDRLRPGMRVKTVGGVIGRIREIREEGGGLKTAMLETEFNGKTNFALYDIQAIYMTIDEPGAVVVQEEPTPAQIETPAPTETQAAEAEEAQTPIGGSDTELNAAEYVSKRNESVSKGKTTKGKKS